MHERTVAPRLLLAGKLIQLLGDFAVEEGGKARVGLNEAECHLLGNDVAKRLAAREKPVPALAMKEGAAVEAVLWTKQRDQIGPVPLLNRPLDHNVERIRNCVLRDDCL